MFVCPYCGLHHLEKPGGDYGNPFDRGLQKTVCLDCGRKLPGSDLSDEELLMEAAEEMDAPKATQPVIVVEMTACAKGIVRKAKAEVPYADGNYPLGDYDYPFPRFSRIIIDGDRLDLDGEISKITGNVLETEKHFIAYDRDKYGWDEVVKIKIYMNESKERNDTL